MVKNRLLSLLMSVLIIFFLVACTPGEELDVDALLTEAEQQVELAGTVTSNITLPTTVVVEELTINVLWSSSNTAVITNTGVVTRPTAATGNVSVTLTATFTYLEEEKVGTFVVIVEALPAVAATVTFNSNGGTSVTTISTTQGSMIAAPTPPTKENHTFGGWYKEVALTNAWNFTTDMVNANITLYAKWVENESFDVTFYLNNDEADVVVSVYTGQKVSAIEDPSHPGYTFSHWSTWDFEVWDFDLDVVTEDMTLFAFYEIITYTVTYVLPAGAELPSPGETSFDVLTPINDLGSAYLENHEFLGWFTAATGGTKVTSIPADTIGNQTLYAQFSEDDQFTVTFNDMNGGITTETLYYGYVTEPTDPIRLGYTFSGWFKDMEGLDDYDFEFDIVSADITLYAKWEIVEYSITYHLHGGEATNPVTYTVETPTFELNEATKLGYTFNSWTNAEVAGTVMTQVTLGTSGNLHFYAQYDVINYTITYMLDGGTHDTPNPTTYQIITETFMLNNASKEGYDFDGWYDAEIEGTLYEEIVVGSTGDITLYARFYELVTLNFYDEQPVNIISIHSNTMFPKTMFAFTDQNELFVKGNNDHGLLGDGTNISKEYWINATGFFGLNEGEVILSVQLIDLMAVAHTSENRFFIWGLFNIDEGVDVYTNDPLDVTGYFDFSLGTPTDFYNYGTFFIVETTDSRLLVYENMAVTDITPVLGVGEVLEWAPNFGFNSIPYSTVIDTGSRILMLNPYDLSMLYDVTPNLNLPIGEEIYAVLSQEFAVHVLTETKYNFATFTGDEMNPVMAMNIDLTISFNPLETIAMHFGGGGFITSEGRLLVPMYIVENEESEMPIEVIYHDVTADLMLEVSETIVSTFDPFFVMTSLDRVLMIQIDNNFTDNPLAVPVLEVIDMELDQVHEVDEFLIHIIFVGYELYVHTNKGIYALIFGQETLVLEPLIITSIGLVFSDIYSVNELDDLYSPVDRMYEDFTMWYIDPELTIPFSTMNVMDGMNLYAGWEDTHYFIDFQFYVSYSLPKMAVEIGQIPVAPADPVVAHQVFNGWYYYDEEDNYQTYDFSYAIDFNVTMYSSFNTAQYDVIFQFETEDPIVTQAYAYTSYGDLTIEVPEGYEVVAVYLDEDMLIPFDPELQVLSNIILYVAIDQMTINVYYYHDTEDVVFVDIFATDLASYGFTNDGRVFAWGSNNYGGLGIGMDHINHLNTPYDITSLLNLSMGEEITQTYAYYSTKVFVTSLGRVLAWGYPDPDYNYFGSPQDITSRFNFQMGEEVVDVYLLYNSLYLFTDLGTVYIFDFDEDSIYSFTTTIDFLDVLYLDQINYDKNNIVIIIPGGVYQLSSILSGDAAVETELGMSFTDEIFKVTTNFQAYNQFFVYTREGRVYIYNHNDITFVESFDLSLNEFETLDKVFEYNWDLKLYYTSAGRLYKHLGEGVTTEFDLSELAVGEKLLEVMYGSGFYTSEGNVAYIDTMANEISFMNPVFVIGAETVIFYQTIDYNVVAFTTANIYVTSGDPAMEFTKTVGIDLMIEQYVYGDIFELALTAVKNVGLTPFTKAIRGGTDGARLTYEGLICPNIGTGGYQFHGRLEFCSINQMKKAVQVLIEIVKIAAKH